MKEMYGRRSGVFVFGRRVSGCFNVASVVL